MPHPVIDDFTPNPNRLFFGIVPILLPSYMAATWVNTSATRITVSTLNSGGTNPAEFSVPTTAGAIAAPPGGPCTPVNVVFTPLTEGDFSGTITPVANVSAVSIKSLRVNGTGAARREGGDLKLGATGNAAVPPYASFGTNKALDFGKVEVDTTKTLDIPYENATGSEIDMEIFLQPQPQRVFTIGADQVKVPFFKLPANKKDSLVVQFTPKTKAHSSNVITFLDKTGLATAWIVVTGEGIPKG